MSDSPSYQKVEEYQNRLKKLEEIKKLSINPYPYSYAPTHSADEIKSLFASQDIGHSDDAASGSTELVRVAGRLVLFRAMGKNAFGHLQDETGRVQIMFNRDLTKVEGLLEKEEIKPIKFIEKKIDLGDIIGIEGNIFRTQKGEITIFAKKVVLLSKSLLPLPDKHSGLADKGVRYRKRWLDLIANSESKDKLVLRSKILQEIRRFFEKEKFLEVETPILQNVYGGAEAEPFKTHLNALHQDMYLRISLEIPLKKLIVGGLQKIFEIGKVFRNEGLDRTHNPEFTLLEAYAAYFDYNSVMEFVENLFESVAMAIHGKTELKVINDKGEELTIDVKAPWKRMTMKEATLHYSKIDVKKLSDDEMKKLLKDKSKLEEKEINAATRGKLIALVFEEFAEKHLIQPHHITDHPIETTPLCKPHRDPKANKEHIVERFESFILGGEMCNAYSELNDPILQRELLVEQSKKTEKTAHPLDEEFVEAICQGMPPTGGFGIGVDRMVMLMTNANSIRDVIYFPLMKPED